MDDISSPELTNTSDDELPAPKTPVRKRMKRKQPPKTRTTSASPKKSPSKRHTDLEEEEEDDEDDGGLGQSSSKQGLIQTTSADAYFVHHSIRCRTSDTVFTDKYPPLTPEEYASANPSLHARHIGPPAHVTSPALFSRLSRELDEGFNLLCYGFGSKREVLNRFAREVCAKKGHVIVSNAFRPDFTLKTMLNSIEERVPAIAEHAEAVGSTSSTSIDSQVRRIYNFFSSLNSEPPPDTSTSKAKGKRKAKPDRPQPPKSPPLFLIIHNVDSPALRTPKAKSVLSLLALNPAIHLIASIDHLNAPLLFSSEEAFARKHPPRTLNDTSEEPPSTRGFAWLWHDLTTLEGYDVETSYADRSSISGLASGRKNKDAVLPSAGGPGAITETAALHVMASVTSRAQQLFALMARRQLDAFDEEAAAASSPQKDSGRTSPTKASGAGSGANDMRRFAIPYDTLFRLAREKFLAQNDSALRAILGEFRDHNLVVSAQMGGLAGEILWIPMRKERLLAVLNSMSAADAQ